MLQIFLRNRKLKYFMVRLLLVCTIFTTFFTVEPEEVSADSNSLRKTYLDLMGGTELNSIESVDELTSDDLKCIALFLSNFYVPFATALDDNSDSSKAVKSNMIEALEGIGFESNTAEKVVDLVFKTSLDTATPIYACLEEAPMVGFNWGKDKDFRNHAWALADDYAHETENGYPYIRYYENQDSPYIGYKTIWGKLGDGLYCNEDFVGAAIENSSSSFIPEGMKDVGNKENFTPATMWIFNCDLHYQDIGNSSLNKNFDMYTDASSSSSGYYTYNSESNTFTRVFKWDWYTKLLFITSLTTKGGNLNEAHNKGYFGNALTAFELSESEDIDNISDLEYSKLGLITQKLYVDWVGNILVDLGDYRAVLVPACINSTTLSNITDSETDTNLNLISIQGFRLLNLCGYWDEADPDDSDTKEQENHYNFSKGLTYCIDLEMERGSASYCDWDGAHWKNDAGGAGLYKDFLTDDLGVIIQESAYNQWDYESINAGFDGDNYHALHPGNTVSEFLVYKSISSATLDNNGSAFEKTNILDSNFVNKFFTSTGNFSDIDDPFCTLIGYNSSDKIILSNMFLTYAFAYANKGATTFDEATNYINLKFNADLYPKGTESLDWSSIDTTDNEIKSFIYYLLHPSEGIAYVTSLIKAKAGGLFIGIHEDMVGATSSNSTTGMTRYLGFTGYATSPALDDIEFIANLLEGYNSLIVFLIIFMTLILLCYVLVGSLTLQRGIVGLIIFAVFAFIPPIAINSTVNVINTTCDSIYSSKFDYWAICQLQTYLGQLSNTVGTSDKGEYILGLLQTNESQSTSASFSGARVKWMSPKKLNELSAAGNELSESTLGDTFSSNMLSYLTNALSNANKSEEFISDGLYLYRDMADIYIYASTSYNLYSYFNFGGTLTSVNDQLNLGLSNTSSSLGSVWKGSSYKNLQKMKYSSGEYLHSYILANDMLYTNYSSGIKSYIKDTSSLAYINKGFLYNSTVQDTSKVYNTSYKMNYYSPDNSLSSALLLNYSTLLNKIQKNSIKLDKVINGDTTLSITLSDMDSYIFGLSTSDFDYGKSEFTAQGNSSISDRDKLVKNLSGYYYSLYTESPFYYFSYHVRDCLKAKNSYNYDYKNLDSSSTEGNLRHLLLDNNQEYFYNLEDTSGDGYGELRDFMNFHDFFYYIIPCLAEGNNMVDKFDDVFGMTTHEDCSLNIDAEGNICYDGLTASSFSGLLTKLQNRTEQPTDEELYKLWHNYNVITLFNCYTTWLDTMQDCDYAKSEEISIMGESFEVFNPLDPTSYYRVDDSGDMVEGRYMVFSRSEMAYYGLDWEDLTKVEQKIITVQDNVYRESINLMNYYSMSDEVLIESFAMCMLFEFNKEFSQTSLISDDYVLYPQGYELKAFTYDAYMRLILSEATGENLMMEDSNEGGIYERILKNTSLFFGLFLILNDVIAVYLIPILKLAFLVLIFFISVALIISASVKMEFNVVTVMWKSIIAPLCAYGLVSIGMAYIVSLFMSNGAQGVVDSGTTIVLGDPTMAVIVMIIINIAVVVLYWKICKKCFKDFKTYVTAIADNLSATVVGAIRKVTGGFGGSGNRVFKRQPKYMRTVAKTAKQRGKDNTPQSGRAMVTGGLVAGAMAGAVDNANEVSAKAGTNKYDMKALNKANAATNTAQGKVDKLEHKADMALANGNTARADRLSNKAIRADEKRKNKYEFAKDIVERGRFGAYKQRAFRNINNAKNTVSNTIEYGSKTISKAKGVGTSVKNTVTAKGKNLISDVKDGTLAVKTATGVSSAVQNVKDGAVGGAYKIKRGALGVANAGKVVKDTGVKAISTAGRNIAGAVDKVTDSDWRADKRRAIGRNCIKVGKATIKGINTTVYKTSTSAKSVGNNIHNQVISAQLAYSTTAVVRKNARDRKYGLDVNKVKASETIHS